MPILPIDTGRYGTPDMLKIFEEETRVQKLLDVEAALALAHAEVGNISRKDAEKIAGQDGKIYFYKFTLRITNHHVHQSEYHLIILVVLLFS